MNRAWRLLTPSCVFVVVAGLLVAEQRWWSWPPLRGGLLARAGYAAALQVLVTVFVLTVSDDILPGEPRLTYSSRAFRTGIAQIAARPRVFRSALASVYRETWLAPLLTSFGAALTLSGIVNGLLTHQPRSSFVQQSEVAMATLWAVALVAYLFVADSYAVLGFNVGFGTAAGIGECVFHRGTTILVTLVSWFSFTAGVCALCLALIAITKRLRARYRRSPQARQQPDKALAAP